MSKKLDHLAAQLTPPPTAEAPPAPTEAAPAPVDPLAPNKAPTWEQLHQRATFHLPREVVARVRATAKAEGLSASAWVARALGAALDD
ncbi:MAG: hypothetical protein GX471_12985 [Candidatus Microthrix parvicella]|jgi:hypothetical protein|nr:hypothetical protein [Candidatus Microthrix parvicella]